MDADFDLQDPPVLTKQLRRFQQHPPRPWMTEARAWLTEDDDRTVHLIFDDVGHAGKTIWTEAMVYEGLASFIPPFDSVGDLMAIAYAAKKKTAFIMDMPRGTRKHMLGDLYAGVESIKDGKAYDKRYNWKMAWFDRPAMIIFAKRMPVFSCLAEDRWAIHEMQPDYSLKLLTIPQAINVQKSPDRVARAMSAEEEAEDEEGDVAMASEGVEEELTFL